MLNYILFRIRILFSREKYKIIFLDFDGVLCPIDDSINDVYDRFGRMFNKECVDNFNTIISKTNAHIVIISSWRGYLSLRKLRKMWRRRKMAGEIVDITPDISIHRGDEIDAWLTRKCFKGVYVIIDDMDYRQFNSSHFDNLVTCNGRLGLTTEDVEKAIKILSNV